MITTYSYLDQYKQIGLGTPIDYFVQIGATPFPLTIILSNTHEYTITLSELPVKYTITLSELPVEYTITLSESGGG